jgi:hypothetical protein
MAGEEKEGGEQKRTGKGKKRKQLPTTAEFQHPDVRYVALPFLSNQGLLANVYFCSSFL